MKKLLMVLVLMFTGLSVVSCSTMHGAGQDLEDVGDALKDATN